MKKAILVFVAFAAALYAAAMFPGRLRAPLFQFFLPFCVLVVCVPFSVIAYQKKKNRFRLLLVIFTVVSCFNAAMKSYWGESLWRSAQPSALWSFVMDAYFMFFGALMPWVIFLFALVLLTRAAKNEKA